MRRRSSEGMSDGTFFAILFVVVSPLLVAAYWLITGEWPL